MFSLKNYLSKLYWQKNNFKNENYIEKLKAGLKIKPNKPEKILDKILSELFPNSYKYVGNFEIWIGGKNPDFICENRKKIIEFFGTYYHEESHEDIRTSHFLKYGYQTLIIWEDEIENIEEVKRRIKEFHGEENGKTNFCSSISYSSQISILVVVRVFKEFLETL